MTLIQRCPDGLVRKVMTGSASAPITWTNPLAGHLGDYVTALTDAGVRLPDGLTVTSAGVRPVVEHPWLTGIALPDLAAHDPERFLAHVHRIAGWVTALQKTSARLDTNLANYLHTSDGELTCIDILPPLLVELRSAPADGWHALFGALCYDTDITLCALSGYAARALLTGHGRMPSASRRLGLCPGHRDPGRLAARWFHRRGQAALAALDGNLPAATALEVFTATSMLRLRHTPAHDQRARITAGLTALDSLPQSQENST